MDREQQIDLPVLELEYTLSQLLKKRQSLYLKGCNDEKLNDKIRDIQQKLREAK